MKFKILLSIFLAGIIIGVVIAPLATSNLEQAIISPISPTMAETKDLILPVTEGEVLGASADEDEEIIDLKVESNDSQPKNSEFAKLINQNIEESTTPRETPVDTKITEKTLEPQVNQSSYSGKVTIAAVGDSMTDLMGRDLDYLKKQLVQYYPKTDFWLLNYGVGAQNIEKGTERIKGAYDYQDRHYEPLAKINPDIVIIESFAYNPFESSEGEINRHWSDLATLVDFVKNNTKAKIIMLATIAPAKANFGQGPAGVNWPLDMSWQHATRINQYLENTVHFAQSAGLPLVDVYHQSLLANGEGNPAYINPGDHIHQNVAGDELIASLLAQKIYSLKLF